MNNKDILQSDLLDILFDKRNKAYGAYELRKHYGRRLIKSLVIAFVLAGGVVTMVLFVKKDIGAKSYLIDDNYIVKIFEEAKPLEKPVEPQKPKAAAAPAVLKRVASQNFTNITIVDNVSKADKLANNLDQLAISNRTADGDPPTAVVYVPEPIKTNAGGEVVPVAPKADNTTPRLTAEVMPSFPGGMSALKKFLEKNLQSFDDMEEGKVVSVKVTFVVGFDGKLKGFEILEDGGDIYNKEVLRVLKKMPEWIPGKANGENVSVYYTIPVKFMGAQ